jgi:hypothetical protein
LPSFAQHWLKANDDIDFVLLCAGAASARDVKPLRQAVPAKIVYLAAREPSGGHRVSVRDKIRRLRERILAREADFITPVSEDDAGGLMLFWSELLRNSSAARTMRQRERKARR